MLSRQEQQQKLIAKRSQEYQTRADRDIANWARINAITLMSGLIPRFWDTYTLSSYYPEVSVTDVGAIYAARTILMHRLVIVFDQNFDETPGFLLFQEQKTDSPVYLDLATDLCDGLRREKDEVFNMPDEEIPGGRLNLTPPYWWPDNYPSNVVDCTNYANLDGKELETELPIEPFEGKVALSITFDAGSNPEIILGNSQEAVNAYFAALRDRLSRRATLLSSTF